MTRIGDVRRGEEEEETRFSGFAPDNWVGGDHIHQTEYTKGKAYGEKDSFRFGDVKQDSWGDLAHIWVWSSSEETG